MHYSTSLFTACVLIALQTGPASAFDEDGFKSGMSVEEVKAQLPKAKRPKYKLARISDSWQILYLDQAVKRKAVIPEYVYFDFCDGALSAVYKEHYIDESFARLADTLLQRYGQPSKVETWTTSPDEIALRFGMRWLTAPDIVYLTLQPYLAATNKFHAKPASVILAFTTPSKRCPSEHAEWFYPKATQTPFGDLSLDRSGEGFTADASRRLSRGDV